MKLIFLREIIKQSSKRRRLRAGNSPDYRVFWRRQPTQAWQMWKRR